MITQQAKIFQTIIDTILKFVLILYILSNKTLTSLHNYQFRHNLKSVLLLKKVVVYNTLFFLICTPINK
ncbi:hypothetical protein SAMN06265350_10635 [Solitalea koreensis]|uniref:Uncharacterized protein n=1 Tax=Solitalea koreensis TaxID=543615 RepID=A0A521D7M5_9SPHI|nr:hypothetical protein SAMN06265350_10635 [Solitalea koreensis]